MEEILTNCRASRVQSQRYYGRLGECDYQFIRIGHNIRARLLADTRKRDSSSLESTATGGMLHIPHAAQMSYVSGSKPEGEEVQQLCDLRLSKSRPRSTRRSGLLSWSMP